MVGKTNVAGARLRAVIAVTYPVGSICTCYNGTKTLKAKDTSGKALFNVSTGAWTVSATDGNKTKSGTVSITQEGQCANVIIEYEIFVYNYITKVWYPHEFQTLGIPANSSAPDDGYPSVTKLEDGSIIISQENGGSVYSTAGFVIDLTNYKKITFVGNIGLGTSGSGCSFCIWDGLQGYWQQNIVASVSAPITGSASIDITNLVGSYSVGFGLYGNVSIGLWQIILS